MSDEVKLEWRWVDDKGRAMTSWKSGDPPPVLDLEDSKGKMHVEVRVLPHRSKSMELTERERGIWRAAITLANNICVQECDRINDDDGSMEAIDATNECAKRIREWAEPSDEQLAEMFGEAGVPQ